MAERARRVNIDHVDDAALGRLKVRCGRLAQEQRCLEVRADQVVPVLLGNFAERRRVETRRVVDQCCVYGL